MTATERVMPRFVFDALSETVGKYGGVGAGKLEDDAGRPLCIHGMDSAAAKERGVPQHALCDAINGIGLDAALSDAAVQCINARKGEADLNARVSWEEYVTETNIVRGDS